MADLESVEMIESRINLLSSAMVEQNNKLKQKLQDAEQKHLLSAEIVLENVKDLNGQVAKSVETLHMIIKKCELMEREIKKSEATLCELKEISSMLDNLESQI
ncbi:hypothetical protein BB559_001733 [Furculomyces boomerangus]|uniref:Uncharacterized protein n=2 Tax=Harpellales TaxID=61421 RepID=A0A2T9Z111_9FUNG|nr:hypothetical protein BB559_001733 [Furculomyces boomerangus]PWA03523.1 hypothetical protein BB558_000302 [Smittium angustum]